MQPDIPLVCGLDEPIWQPTFFTKNHNQLMITEMPRNVMAVILPPSRRRTSSVERTFPGIAEIKSPLIRQPGPAALSDRLDAIVAALA